MYEKILWKVCEGIEILGQSSTAAFIVGVVALIFYTAIGWQDSKKVVHDDL